jgi:hypothetical protein
MLRSPSLSGLRAPSLSSAAPQCLFCATFALSVFLLLLILFDMTGALTPRRARTQRSAALALCSLALRQRSLLPPRAHTRASPAPARCHVTSALRVAWRAAVGALLLAIVAATPFYLFYLALAADGAREGRTRVLREGLTCALTRGALHRRRTAGARPLRGAAGAAVCLALSLRVFFAAGGRHAAPPAHDAPGAP